MDMQNVSNLQIPEGMVKTIHDKNNQLLWGAVGYDTKYAGDTYQQTYSGKNLFNASEALEYKWISANTGLVVDSSDPNIVAPLLHVVVGTTYVISGIGDLQFNLFTYSDDSFSNPIRAISNSREIRTFTATTEWLRFSIGGGNAVAIKNDIQFEIGDTSTDYEPYVGSAPTQITPSPNPDYPQDIQVVTGEQTVSISDGINTQSYTINLGSIELCKIGTYQDYIYKSGDDWYVYKEIGKVDFSTLTWTKTVEGIRGTTEVPNIKYVSSNQEIGSGLAEKYIIRKGSGLSNWLNYMAIDIAKVNVKTGSDSVDPTGLFYYALATPTNTKITDSTLISQLNAIHEWLTRYGYNATVTGNLPIIIDRTNL